LSSEPHTAPFNRRALPVVGVSELGPYRLIEVVDLEAPAVRAGQFHMLSTPQGWDSEEAGRPWLSRAISFLECDGHGKLVFLIDPIGPGTSALARVEVGQQLYAVGPLGNGFPEPTSDTRPLLIGGGIGLAPVLAFADQLDRQGTDYDLVLGFRTGEHASAVRERPGLILATDDGSKGHHGTVMGPVTDLLADGGREVFTCGPPRMMEAIRALCEEREATSWLALESPMACGFGACFGCAVETKDGILRLCVDGPVLNGSRLAGVSATGRVDG
jgi:NAD(P)H-flavin reductase